MPGQGLLPPAAGLPLSLPAMYPKFAQGVCEAGELPGQYGGGRSLHWQNDILSTMLNSSHSVGVAGRKLHGKMSGAFTSQHSYGQEQETGPKRTTDLTQEGCSNVKSQAVPAIVHNNKKIQVRSCIYSGDLLPAAIRNSIMLQGLQCHNAKGT